MNQTAQLNLARKWRPKSFDTIIGQQIPVRMLKNSLYLKKYFPVYLFAGQRGCGKTSTARVFAAAINCHKLPDFQADPTSTSIPCLTCESCTAMMHGQHPDFIEIDAASHTGVDNVRQIIESSSYMPLAGKKKIYLIDEVHMLSKAAFNAFLKILEEPPATVMFILATTELQKIPATVVSRCFQAVFNPLSAVELKDHLRTMCEKEAVSIDEQALEILVQETEGCARDAINLLERVRFSGEHITTEIMLTILGKVSNQITFDIFESILQRSPTQLLEVLQKHKAHNLSPQALWDSMVFLCRALLWVKYGVTQEQSRYGTDHAILQDFAQRSSIGHINALQRCLWRHEELFMKTSKKYLFVEMVLIQMCSPEKKNGPGAPPSNGQQSFQPTPPTRQPQRTFESFKTAPPAAPAPPHIQQAQAPVQAAPTVATPEPAQTTNTPWDKFLAEVSDKADLMLYSILVQSKLLGKNEQNGHYKLELSNDGKFFRDKIEESRPIWLPLLQQHFSDFTQFEITARAENKAPLVRKATPSAGPAPQPLARPQGPAKSPSYGPSRAGGYNGGGRRSSQSQTVEYINISDAEKWPLANLIVKHFPGKIKHIKAFS